ncbi:MAG: hypothetical protein ABIS91_07790, partial [Nocardioides sp.]|uniref:hypothetical protein n=1 Tax=Nocardioides sp. TaxID=35761 RepID=UPI003265AC39
MILSPALVVQPSHRVVEIGFAHALQVVDAAGDDGLIPVGLADGDQPTGLVDRASAIGALQLAIE